MDLITIIRSLPNLSPERKKELIAKVEANILSPKERTELQEAILESIVILEDERDTARKILQSS